MAVKYKSLGFITVAVAGTPEQLSATQLLTPGCLIQAAKANVGTVYVMDAAGNKAAELVPGQAMGITGPLVGDFEDEFDLSELKLDAASSGDKALVSYFSRRV